MKKEQCPVCFSPLETIVCTPCHDCGGIPLVVEDFKKHGGNFTLYDVYEGLRLQLCDDCKVDFGGYRSEFFGFRDGSRIGFEHMHLVKPVHQPELEFDKWCPNCRMRLKFLNFLVEVRQKNKLKMEG